MLNLKFGDISLHNIRSINIDSVFDVVYRSDLFLFFFLNLQFCDEGQLLNKKMVSYYL